MGEHDMNSTVPIPHFCKVDICNIRAKFFDDKKHRAILELPLLERSGNKTLCVIGQNPSLADQHQADKTVRYLEELIFKKCPEYSKIIILNLYSRVDTKKKETDRPLLPSCEAIFRETVCKHSDFLLVYGRLKTRGMYKFIERKGEVLNCLRGKKLKIDIGTLYPPHPGNPQIRYRQNSEVRIVPMNL